MKKQSKIHFGSLAVSAVAVVALSVSFAYAQTAADSELTQEINEGVISTSIRNASGAIVASPTFAMTPVAASTTMQTSTGVFGTNEQRITVDNPSASENGGAWTLALNATNPGTTVWTTSGGSPSTYAYNGATAAAGQLTVDPGAGSITADVGGSSGVTRGTQATFTGSTPVSIMTASTAAAPIWNGYITGIGLSQTIPPAQPIGNYTIDLTQTVTAQ